MDLNYEEDNRADVDMNVAMTESGDFVEIQGSGEETTYSRQKLAEMLDYAETGIGELIEIQKSILESNQAE